MRLFSLRIATAALLGLLVLAPTPPAYAQGADAKPAASSETKARKPLTAQQQKMKECGAKWQEEKKAKGVKGRDAWNKFRGECLKKS